ncbi:hypothetical protein Tco_0439105, partial [Tanacetum coccineum]
VKGQRPLRGQGAAPLAGSKGRAPCWGPAARSAGGGRGGRPSLGSKGNDPSGVRGSAPTQTVYLVLRAMAKEDAFLVDDVEGGLCVDNTNAGINGRFNSRGNKDKGKVGQR